jgi:hypothetical protein
MGWHRLLISFVVKMTNRQAKFDALTGKNQLIRVYYLFRHPNGCRSNVPDGVEKRQPKEKRDVSSAGHGKRRQVVAAA